MAQFEEHYLQEARGWWQFPDSHFETVHLSPFAVLR